MINLNRDEIERLLTGLSEDKCAAIAVRTALRALPLLAARARQGDKAKDGVGSFAMWPREDSRRHLLALLSAQSAGLLCLLAGGGSAASHLDADGIAAAHAASSAAVAAASTLSAYVATYTAAAGYVTSSAHAANAVFFAYSAASRAIDPYAAAVEAVCAAHAAASAHAYAAEVAESVPAFTMELVRDLELLEKQSGDFLLQLELWSKSNRPFWQEAIAIFEADATSLDAGFEVWLDWYQDRLAGVAIDLDLFAYWNRVPAEIKAQGPRPFNVYLTELRNRTASHPLNRVRVIFLGHGEAGKTSLIRALHQEPVLEGHEAMTPGINIREWPVDDTGIQAHFWDFGGQVMAHASHQLFLRSSCLYVVVLSARGEVNGTEQAEYWLEHVKGFGASAPVLLVANKADQADVRLDISVLLQKYPNIAGFHSLSCINAQTAAFDVFRQEFSRQLRLVGAHQMLFTPSQFLVLDSVRRLARTNAFVSHAEFDRLCAEHGVRDEGVQNRAWLLDILDKLGIVIHFPQLPYLEEYVLNPRWLTYGVYTLMYAQQARLGVADVAGILSREKLIDEAGNVLDYPKSKCRFIMDAMLQFKLCYPLSHDKNILIIPALLPATQPAAHIGFDKQGALAFEFAFKGFLPRHVMPEMIVNRHEEIENNVVWQCGVLLKHRQYDARALLQVDYHLRALNIWAQGDDAREFLGVLIDEVLQILGRLDLDYTELVSLPPAALLSGPIPRGGTEKASYRQIINQAKAAAWTYFSDSGAQYDVKKVLGIVMSRDVVNNIYGNPIINQGEAHDMGNNTININGGNVGGHVIAGATIKDSFNTTTQDGGAVKAMLDALSALIQTQAAQVDAAPAASAKQSAERFLAEVWRDDAETGGEVRASLPSVLDIGNASVLKTLFKALFSGAAYNWYSNSPVANYESYYAAVMYAYFVGAGLAPQMEDATSLGRIDMTVKMAKQIYIFEFKVVKSVKTGEAMAQIKAKCYADKYRAAGLPIYLVGVEFSKESRNLVGFDFELA